ncbi:MAG: TolC family protein [Hyphomicrobiales bacterium]|nr:TolC family protein [Hyphomicrobiales bacterium]MBV9976948.1 TolC family protein [Hyphomicrobiales bacterium]
MRHSQRANETADKEGVRGRNARRNLAYFLGVAAGALLVAGCALTPKPFTTEERWSEAQADREQMFADQEPVTRSVTLDEAFARALKYNLDGRVKALEEALSVNDLDLARYDLLPKVAIDGLGSTRNRFDASSSESIQTRQQSLVPSTSSDINRFTGDLTLSWSILDFGVSYFAARQEADRVLIAQEERRKAVQALLQDVRRAYWRAAAAQRLTNDVKAAIRAAEGALPAARKVETEGLKSPIDSLRYQKALLDAIRQLETNEQALAVSKDELASLINLPPGEAYTVAVPSEASMRLEPMKIPVGQMESTALLLNPDIRNASYEARISVAETRKALLKLLPGITLSADPNVDSNSFTVHHYWVAGAARLNGYLSNLLTAPLVIPERENAEKLAVLKRQAMSMAVLAKLHIAYQQYFSSIKEFDRVKQLSSVDQRLYTQIANRTATDVQGDLERILAQASAVDSKLRLFQNYAEAQEALGRLYSTVGVDFLHQDVETLSVAELGNAIKQTNIDLSAKPEVTSDQAAASAWDQSRNEQQALPPDASAYAQDD